MLLDKSPDIDHRTIGGEAFIITAEDSRIHSLNGTASFIFDLCDGSCGLAEIVASLVESFDVSEATARADAKTFIDDLLARGLLVQR